MFFVVVLWLECFFSPGGSALRRSAAHDMGHLVRRRRLFQICFLPLSPLAAVSCSPADLTPGCFPVMPNGVVVFKRLVVLLLPSGSSLGSIRYA